MNLTGQFLIAMPAMIDPYFSKTVTYICSHNEDGAMGVIVNRSTDITVAKLFEQIQLESQSIPLLLQPVHFGGPVQGERGFILHQPLQEYDSTITINPHVALTTSKDILVASAQNQGPEKMLVALGYAGWSPGQLEDEVSRNAWLSLETDDVENIHRLIFDAPDGDKFDLAMHLMGFDLASLSEVAGHA